MKGVTDEGREWMTFHKDLEVDFVSRSIRNSLLCPFSDAVDWLLKFNALFSASSEDPFLASKCFLTGM